MTDAEHPPEGRAIAGRFSVEALLGRGGMGAVYRVRDARTGRALALKRGEARDPRKTEKRRALLEREYHTLVQLAHPSIIEVYDYGVDDQGPYYTMELIEGADLEARGKVAWQTACALLRDVASSLAILHSRGLLHRDVSSRNVRCAADGRAKLFDFGAMTSLGVAKDIVGTPPFVAPEALQMQALDARADLFSLGALGYYLLTGRHAFAARRLSELRDVWRSAPTPPNRLVPELPPALSHLILQLLSLDRAARPQSAAEVMERLCAIAGLPIEERAEVSRAYLSTPTLIGREKTLVEVRKRIIALTRGDGGALLIQGVPGSGRSRLLDACVLEGKLLGATVLRADSSDAAAGDWGVARALGNQLVDLLPEAAKAAARLSRPVLVHVLEGLREEGAPPAEPVPERALLLRELRDFVLALSRASRLFLVVDDADRIDEPSAALLAALAHKSEKHGLMLAAAVEHEPTGDASEPSVQLLRSLADAIELEALSAEQSAALVRSVFGDATHLELVAGRIHALARGNPRATMELAQHLCDRGLARYQAGSWSLPSELDEGDLPQTLAASLRARLAPLSADAKEMIDLLALADGDPLTLADYPALCVHGDSARVFRALDELLAARVVVADAERYRFSQRGFQPVVLESIDPRLAHELHARLGRLLGERDFDPMRVAHHLLRGGHEREGVERLCARDLQARLPPLPLAEAALAAAERLDLPARMRHELRAAILSKAPRVMAAETFRRHLPRVLEQLERDSGLAAFREASKLAPEERLHRALATTHERFQATPEHERVYAPLDAIRELARFSANACSMGMQLYDLEFLDALPSLEPLLPLSPALTVVAQMIAASKDALRGSTGRAKLAYERILARLGEPDHAGFDSESHRGIELGITYLLGMIEATLGVAVAEQHAQLLESDREHRVNAWRVRMSMHLNLGNSEEARKCQRRAELLVLQDGTEQRYVGTSAGFELVANAMIGDLIGVKQAIDAVAKLAGAYPGWRPLMSFGHCHYRWLQGDLEGALAAALEGLGLAPGGRHPYFAYLAAARISLLGELGRASEAAQVGGEYLELCRREQLAFTDRWVGQAVALAWARIGERARALELIDAEIADGEKLALSGLSLGALYEARARIAICFRDLLAFESFSARCAAEYKKGKNPVLSARYARLVHDARQAQLLPEEPKPTAGAALVLSHTETAYETVQSRLIECVDPADRARCALTLVLQSVESTSGYLFGVNQGAALAPLASLPAPPEDAELTRWLEEYLRLELESQVSATATADGDDEEPRAEVAARYTDREGRTFEPLLLTARGEHNERVAAVLALHVQPGPRSIPPKELLAEIASQLVGHGDVTGIVI